MLHFHSLIFFSFQRAKQYHSLTLTDNYATRMIIWARSSMSFVRSFGRWIVYWRRRYASASASAMRGGEFVYMYILRQILDYRKNDINLYCLENGKGTQILLLYLETNCNNVVSAILLRYSIVYRSNYVYLFVYVCICAPDNRKNL